MVRVETTSQAELRFRLPAVRGVTVAAASLLLVLTACSGNTEGGTPTSEASLAATIVEADNQPAVDNGSDEAHRLSELDGQEQDEYLSAVLIEHDLVWGPLDNDTARSAVAVERTRLAEIEELVALCMAEQGFEYYPRPTDELVAPGTDPEFDAGTRAWAEHFGFGASTFIVFDDGQLPAGIHGYRGDFLNVRDLDESPNEQYLNSLSDESVRAYTIALAGIDPNDPSPSEYDPATAPGCQAEAERAVPSPVLYENPADSSETLRQRALADVRWIQHESEVAACLAQQGHEPFNNYDQADDIVFQRLYDAGLIPPPGSTGNDNVALLEHGSEEYWDALRQVQEFERGYAVAVFDCGGNREENADLLKQIVSDLLADQ